MKNYKTMKWVCLLISTLAWNFVIAESEDAPDSPPDNTKVNMRDRDQSNLTPGDQSNSKEDLRITKNIRKALMKDKSLSTTAKNVKIITVDGKVTLRGPVKNPAEK